MDNIRFEKPVLLSKPQSKIYLIFVSTDCHHGHLAVFFLGLWWSEKRAKVTAVFPPKAPDEEAETPTDQDSWVHCNNLQAWYWLSDNWSVGLMSLVYMTSTDKSGGLNTPLPSCQYGSSLQTEISDAQKPGYSFEQIMPLLLKDSERCQQELPMWWLGLRGGLGGKLFVFFLLCTLPENRLHTGLYSNWWRL